MAKIKKKGILNGLITKKPKKQKTQKTKNRNSIILQQKQMNLYVKLVLYTHRGKKVFQITFLKALNTLSEIF